MWHTAEDKQACEQHDYNTSAYHWQAMLWLWRHVFSHELTVLRCTCGAEVVQQPEALQLRATTLKDQNYNNYKCHVTLLTEELAAVVMLVTFLSDIQPVDNMQMQQW